MDAKGRESEPACIDDEIPFEIPDGWEWARLSSLGEVVGGGTPKTNDAFLWADKDEGIAWLTPADMKFVKSVYVEEGARFISQKGLNGSSAQLMPANSVLMSSRAPIGYIAISKNPISTNQGFKSLVPQLKRLAPWVYWALQGQIDDIKRRATGTTFKEISGAEFSQTLIPIPPLAEQRRIAERVSGLMPLVEEYGKFEAEREALDAALPDRLRKSVLQMAVEGKLVPQDPSDEPASALLERIREERAKLIKEKKIKAPKGGESVIYLGSDGRRYEKRVDVKGHESEPACIDDEIPFGIPESWEWVRLSSIVDIVSARRVHQSDWKESGVPFYRAREIVKLSKGERFENPLYIEEELYEKLSPSGVPLPGDLMVTGVGTVGATYIVRPGDVFYYKDASVLCLENRFGMSADFLSLVFSSPLVRRQIRNSSSGTTVATITIKNASRYIVPIPPLAEQHCITKRISQFNALITN